MKLPFSFFKTLCFLIPFFAVPLGFAVESTPGAEAAITQALAAHLDQDLQWQNLLNYRRDFLFWKRSQADNPLFFLGKNPWSPREELVATLKTFFDSNWSLPSPDGTQNEKAICVFPGRFLYLKRKLPQVPWPQAACPRFENLRGILNARSVTYVFSSYYINNPSSAFGHSFLRLNRADNSRDGKRFELIDFGLGYAALPTTTNGVLYSFMGIAGFFKGRFETSPYYFKVREYSDFENRDLWEYDLNLTPDEVELLVAHAYELNAAGFDYLYFTENCAYRILAILDAVRPSLHLVDQSKYAVIPGDTVKLVANAPGLTKERHYRPSSRAIFAARLETLTAELKKRLRLFSQDEDGAKLVQNATPEEAQKLLDAAMDFIDFRYAEEVLKETGHFPLKKKILLKRSEVNLISPVLAVPTPLTQAPDQSHGSGRWSFGWQSDHGEKGLSLAHRFALHDLLDPAVGYSPDSEIEMLNLRFSWKQEGNHRFQAEDLTWVDIVSLIPWDDFNRGLSWRLKFASERSYATQCQKASCLPLILDGGVGVSAEWSSFLWSAWLKEALATSPQFRDNKWIPGAGPALLARYRWSPRATLLAEAWYRYDLGALKNEIWQGRLQTQWNFTKDWGLRLSTREDRQYRLELNISY